jgi:hypothetical protein
MIAQETQPMIEWSCMTPGPDLYDHTTEGLLETSCTKPRGHDDDGPAGAEWRHVWWNDEGTVCVQWEGSHPFNYGDGSWRQGSE